jgi:hypothetical protein
VLLALLALGALHLLFGDQAGLEKLIAQGEAHAPHSTATGQLGYDRQLNEE